MIRVHEKSKKGGIQIKIKKGKYKNCTPESG